MLTILVCLALLLAFLAILLCFGFMREAVMLRQQVFALTEMLTHPPAPEYVGQQGAAPRALLDLPRPNEGRWAILFLSDTCPSCDEVGADLIASPFLDQYRRVIQCVFISNSITAGAGALSERCSRQGYSVSLDDHGRLFEASRITGTPTAVIIEGESVTAFKAGFDMSWLEKEILLPATRPAIL